ncbi:Protein NYNRIN [Labeo rohita]|uniref:Gypsy retrotransposon integrase-like protein 1 n=1 Tax=Labeo rohita TaxID=84645 RepID=A0ABQ8LBB9_LABRO|nr:Protein NYNRIN [Labeo rohita]
MQLDDPTLGPFLVFFSMKKYPSKVERQSMSKSGLELLRQWGRLFFKEGLLYRHLQLPDGGEGVDQLVLPEVLWEEVFRQLHDGHGHQGRERTYELIRRRCYWPSMSAYVQEHCQNCWQCSISKSSHPVARAPMGHLLASKPNQILAIDFTTLEPSSDGRENVLIMTDVFSKYTLAVPTRDQRAITVASVLVQEWFYKLGVPARIHSDQGRNFESATPRLPVDFLLGGVENPVMGSVEDWVARHQEGLRVTYGRVKARLEEAAAHKKTLYDQAVKDQPLIEGQLVHLRESGVRGRNKIQNQWSTKLYKIVRAPRPGGQVYSISPLEEPLQIKHVHRSLLKVAPVLVQRANNIDLGLQRKDSGEHECPEDSVVVVMEPLGHTPMDDASLVTVRDVTPDCALPLAPAAISIAREPSVVELEGLRRSNRATAGKHSNRHHLPRTVIGNVSAGVLTPPENEFLEQGVVNHFRPWL